MSVIALDTFPAITTNSLPSGSLGAGYTAAVVTTGYPAPQVTVTAGSLPPGVSLDPATGALSGTPTAVGTYSFTVTAASTVSGILSAAVQAYTVTIAAVPPDAPLAPTATAGSARVDLAWTAPTATGGSPVTGYRIERSVGSGPFTVLVADTGSAATAYTDSSVVAGQSYSYRVLAITAAGAGAASTTATAAVPAPAPTPSPTASPSATPTPTPSTTPSPTTPAGEPLASTGSSPSGRLTTAAVLILLGMALTVTAAQRARRNRGLTR